MSIHQFTITMDSEYYKTTESVEEYIKLAKGHDGSQLIKKIKKFLPLNSSLLEIGSGPGVDWKILNESYKVIGSDSSVVFLDRLKLCFPKAMFLELNAISLSIDKKFDGIYSNKVMHHLKDDELEASIKRQHTLLNSNGIICHSFWKGEGSEIYNGLFANYYSNEQINHLFQDYFNVLLLENYKEFEEEDSIFFIGKKK